MERKNFDEILLALADDLESGALIYEKVRHSLMRFFASRGVSDPEGLASETLSRVEGKIASGQRLDLKGSLAYFFAVANNVLHEYWDKVRRQGAALADLPPGREPSVQPEIYEADDRLKSEKLLECQKKCLGKLPPGEDDLLRTYWSWTGSLKVNARAKLAKSMGIPLATLRTQVHRLRVKLKKCVEECLAERAPG